MKSKRNKIIITIIFAILILFIVLFFIIKNANYKLDLTFNDEFIQFLNKETLYYHDDVNIDIGSSTYKMKVNGKRISHKPITLNSGKYKISFSKYFVKYTIYLDIDYDRSVFIVDEDGKEIHNYLSNTKPFYIKKALDDIRLTLDNIDYQGELIVDYNNYLIQGNDELYNVNILDIND